MLFEAPPSAGRAAARKKQLLTMRAIPKQVPHS